MRIVGQIEGIQMFSINLHTKKLFLGFIGIGSDRDGSRSDPSTDRDPIRSDRGMDRDPRRSDPIDRGDPRIGSDRDRISDRIAPRGDPIRAVDRLDGSQIRKIAIRSGSDHKLYEPIHKIGDPIRSDRRITDHITQAWARPAGSFVSHNS